MKLFPYQIIFKLGIQSENIVFEKGQNNMLWEDWKYVIIFLSWKKTYFHLQLLRSF